MMSSSSLSILLAHPDPGRRAELRDQIVGLGHAVAAEATTSAELVGAALKSSPDMIVTAVGFDDGSGVLGLLEIAQVEPRPAILVASHVELEEVEASLSDHVMAFLIEPVGPEDLKPAIYLVEQRYAEFQELRAQVADLEAALHSRKQVEKAKGRLMETRGLSERDAYRALQRLATDRRKKLVDVAEAVLLAAELDRMDVTGIEAPAADHGDDLAPTDPGLGANGGSTGPS